MRLGATPSILDKGLFVWTKEQIVIGIVACFVDDVLWGENQEFSDIKQLRVPLKLLQSTKKYLIILGFTFSKTHISQQYLTNIITSTPWISSHTAQNNQGNVIAHFPKKKPLC